VAPGANAKVTPQDVEANLSIIREAGVVLTQLEIPLETVEHLSGICRREDVPLILDPAPASDLPPEIFRNLAWFTPNESEAAFFAGNTEATANETSPDETARRLFAKGCRGVLLKMGSRGAYLATPENPGRLVPAFSVTAVDTTAAGDAFNSGFATGLMLGKSAVDSAVFASAVAAISVTRAGAQPSMPTMPEVERFLENDLARK
jgi:ribokinase